MKLSHLFDLELDYVGEVVPVGGEGEHVQFHGMGVGTLSGNDMKGTLEFENAPWLNSGVFSPHLKMVLRLDSGETLKLSCRGFSLLPREDEIDHRRFTTFVEFHSAARRFKWVKSAVGIQEGILHMPTRKIFSKVYVVDNDHPLMP